MKRKYLILISGLIIFVTALIDGKIYVAGGVGKDGLSNKLEVYDIKNDRWEAKLDAPTKRDHLAAVAYGDKLYVVGG